jgi:hypothetical protein
MTSFGSMCYNLFLSSIHSTLSEKGISIIFKSIIYQFNCSVKDEKVKVSQRLNFYNLNMLFAIFQTEKERACIQSIDLKGCHDKNI